MIVETNNFNNEDITNNFFLDFPIEDCILFDIETTGLSSTKHMIYLIGFIYYKDKTWHSENLLATNLDDESLIISRFLDMLQNKTHLIHFNGTTFDIPFIKKRAQFHNIASIHEKLDTIHSIDLYKLAKKHSNFLNLENYKLKTIEKALGINRVYLYTGKELIDTYFSFIKAYALDVLKNEYSNSNKLKDILLLHNYEDIINMIPLLSLFKYDLLYNNHYSIESYEIENNYLHITCLLTYKNQSYELPNKINIHMTKLTPSPKIIGSKNKFTISIPLLDTELKFFYPDYKNYYYLPLEDTAIHKSVGQFVDKEHRIQAKASNCYIKKKGLFIPTLDTFNYPYFTDDYNSKTIYLEVTDKFLSTNLLSYVSTLLSNI